MFKLELEWKDDLERNLPLIEKIRETEGLFIQWNGRSTESVDIMFAVFEEFGQLKLKKSQGQFASLLVVVYLPPNK